MRILRAPAELARLAWGFINPARQAGQLPWGRIAIVAQLVAAVVFAGYTLAKKSIRVPLSSAPYEVQVELADAQGLDRQDEPAAAVAGTPLGRVSEVRYEDGIAVATLVLAPEVRGKVFADATAVVRPASAIQNLTVNVTPGSPEAGPLPDGQRIPVARSQGFVTIDELTSVLDADTQAYVQILVSVARRGLEGSESELRAALGELGELAETATPIARTLARRRELLTSLVGELETVATTLAERRSQLAETIDASGRLLAVTAGRDAELAGLTAALAPTLTAADSAVEAARGLAEPLVPALDTLTPTLPALTAGLGELRTTLPVANGLVGDFDALTREGRRPIELLLLSTAGLDRKARAMMPTVRDLAALAELLDRYKEGSAQTADTLSGALSVSDNGGVYGQVDVLKFEPAKPENLGFPAAAGSGRGERPGRMERLLAVALERVCERENPWACVARFSVPGLPERPLTAGRGGEG